MIRVFSILFRITGIPREKASFQAISLLTNAGYTTTESEVVVSLKTRRHIATAAMLTGYFFSVVIVSLFINLFLNLDFSHFDTELAIMFLGFGGLALFFTFLRIPKVQNALNRVIEGITFRAFEKASRENFISILDTYGEDAVVNVFLFRVPEILKGKCLAESDIRKKYNVNILMYTRNGQNHYVKADTIFSPKDILIAFGPLAAIKDTFLLKEHETTVREKDDEKNEVTVMSNFGYQIMAEIKIKKIPVILAEKSLVESRIKDYFSINIMMVTRKDKPLTLTKDTVIMEGDRVIAFGPYDSIHTVFENI